MKKIGYHYTSFENWENIYTKGFLEPRCNANITALLGSAVPGIWLWQELPKRKAHIGNVIRVMSETGEDNVVVLRVSYDESDVPQLASSVPCAGNVGLWQYQMYQMSLVVTRKIPLDDIVVLETVNLSTAYENQIAWFQKIHRVA